MDCCERNGSLERGCSVEEKLDSGNFSDDESKGGFGDGDRSSAPIAEPAADPGCVEMVEDNSPSDSENAHIKGSSNDVGERKKLRRTIRVQMPDAKVRRTARTSTQARDSQRKLNIACGGTDDDRIVDADWKDTQEDQLMDDDF